MGKVKKTPVKTAAVSTQFNDGILCTRNLILRSVCFVYLCAFLTFYYQSPGLFGQNGILPAHLQVENIGKDIISAIHQRPTLLHFAPYLGINTDYMIDLVSIFGALIAFTGFVSQKFCVAPTFAALWSLYFSLIQISQEFTHQSDHLLLEAGFLCLILAPLTSTKCSSITDKIGINMLKWLLFRFLFASGTVKFFSGCPYWWSFNALARHYRTLPLPTPLSWYVDKVPKGFWKVGNIFTNMSEVICPWFFFFPSRAVRKFLFYWELFLQFNIILTGNYGFLNFLVIALLITLLDDTYFKNKSKKDYVISTLVSMAVFTAILIVIYFGCYHFIEKLTFKNEDLGILRSMIKLSPLIPMVAVIATFLTNVLSHPVIKNAKSFWKKASDINTLLAFTLCSLALIGMSVVPHHNIDTLTNITNTQLGKYYQEANRYMILNEYGRHLRRMRPDRLEITLEYTDNVEDAWSEIPFLYKPWSVNESLPFAGPYLPRLDMKFYDAATVNYRDHPWILSLTYRLLQNEPSVLKLLGIENKLSPSPKYVRGILNRFAYTPLTEKITYFKRKVVGEHFPAFSLDNPTFLSYVKSLNSARATESKVSNVFLKNILDLIRSQVSLIEGHILILGVVVAGIALILSRN